MDSETSRQQHTLMGTDDAMVWAEEFCRIFNGKMIAADEFNHTEPGPVDPGTMVSWFANAMQVAVTLNRTRELHAAGELTETEEFLERWHEEHPEDGAEETWDDEDFKSPPNDDIIDLVEALQRDEADARAREQEFLEGFNEGRDEHDYIDPYGDTP